MDQRLWGPSAWYVLHGIFNEEIIYKTNKNLQAIFELIEFILPCPICRECFSINSKSVFAEFGTSIPYRFILFKVHNKVNSKTGKRLINYFEFDGLMENRNKDKMLSNLFYFKKFVDQVNDIDMNRKKQFFTMCERFILQM